MQEMNYSLISDFFIKVISVNDYLWPSRKMSDVVYDAHFFGYVESKQVSPSPKL